MPVFQAGYYTEAIPLASVMSAKVVFIDLQDQDAMSGFSKQCSVTTITHLSEGDRDAKKTIILGKSVR